MARAAETYRAARRNTFRHIWDSVAKIWYRPQPRPQYDKPKGSYGRHIIRSEHDGLNELHATKGWRVHRVTPRRKQVAWWLPA